MWRNIYAPGGGSRKGSRNLWIYENATGKKRFSVTTSAGVKIQPYFDVPPPNDPNLYIFTVIGEVILDGRVRCWLSRTTWRDLEKALGTISPQTVSQADEFLSPNRDAPLTSFRWLRLPTS